MVSPAEAQSCLLGNSQWLLKACKSLPAGPCGSRGQAYCSENHFSFILSDHSLAINCKILMRKFGGSVTESIKKWVYSLEMSHLSSLSEQSLVPHLARPYLSPFTLLGVAQERGAGPEVLLTD